MENSILAYAFNAEKKLVYINDVKNGLECGCVCPGCGEMLVAKNDGKIREHHFAHLSGNDCGTGYQTIRHIWAKELLVTNQLVPIVLNGKKLFIRTNKIGMEVKLTDLNIIPDVFAVAKLPFSSMGLRFFWEVPFIVEIYVTHKVDEEKSAIIKQAGIPAVEIDLSKSTAITLEELVKDLSNSDNWNIINDKIGNSVKPKINLPNIAYRTSYNMNHNHYYKRHSYHRKRF